MTITAPSTLNNARPSVGSTVVSRSVVQHAFGIVVPLALVALGYWSVRNVDASRSGPLGIVEVLPVSFYMVTFALAFSFVLQLRTRHIRNVVLSVHLIALIALLHGVMSWIEGSPRFPVTYTHLGLIEYIQRTNETLPSLDARMSWPGFFAMSALINNVVGVNSSYIFTLWAPLVFNLAYAPLVFSLAQTVSSDRRVPWMACWLFFSVSWVGQDYFSPQAVNFLFYLAFMNIVLHFFRSDRAAFPKILHGMASCMNRLARRVFRSESMHPGGAPMLVATSSQRALLVVGLIVIYAASVVSHQLTPFFLLFDLVLLVALRRVALRGFPTLMIVVVFGYISFGAVGFWSGHLKEVFGSIGQVSAVAEQNVGAKVGQQTNHVYVIYGRLALTASLWMIAGLGLINRLRRGRTDIFVIVGFLSPFLVLASQSYGGEAILRVFLFSLPFAAVLAVLAVLPSDAAKLNGMRTGVIVVVASLLVPAFMLARFGNEQYEYVAKNEYVAAQKLREIAPVGSQLIGVSPNINWRISGEGLYTFSLANDITPYDDPNQIYQAVASKGTRATYMFLYAFATSTDCLE